MKFAPVALAITATFGGLLASSLPSKAYEYGSYSLNTIGNNTYINGYNSRGSYNGSTSTIGNTTFFSGNNSSGNYVNGSCTSIGTYVNCYSY